MSAMLRDYTVDSVLACVLHPHMRVQCLIIGNRQHRFFTSTVNSYVFGYVLHNIFSFIWNLTTLCQI
jgi:hypothetical protein